MKEKLQLKKLLTLKVFILFFCSPLVVWASEGGYYTTVGAGFLFYNSDIDEKTELDYAANFEVSLGEYTPGQFAVDVAVNYTHDGHEGDDLRYFGLSLVVMKLFPLSHRNSFFVGGGFTNSFFSSYTGHIYGEEKRDRDFKPGINLLAGLEFDVSAHLFTRFQLGYRLIRKFEFEDGTLDPSGFSAILKFGYKFKKIL